MYQYVGKQKSWVKEHGIKIGDKLNVIRRPNDVKAGESKRSKEIDWNVLWNDRMNKYIGKTIIVFKIEADGIVSKNGKWVFPYFILEPIKEAEKLGEKQTNIGDGKMSTTEAKKQAQKATRTEKIVLADIKKTNKQIEGFKSQIKVKTAKIESLKAEVSNARRDLSVEIATLRDLNAELKNCSAPIKIIKKR